MSRWFTGAFLILSVSAQAERVTISFCNNLPRDRNGACCYDTVTQTQTAGPCGALAQRPIKPSQISSKGDKNKPVKAAAGSRKGN
jgi:hypothetical protein